MAALIVQQKKIILSGIIDIKKFSHEANWAIRQWGSRQGISQATLLKIKQCFRISIDDRYAASISFENIASF